MAHALKPPHSPQPKTFSRGSSFTASPPTTNSNETPSSDWVEITFLNRIVRVFLSPSVSLNALT